MKKVIQEIVKKVFNCYFCQIQLKTNKNNYLKNRYKLQFWNHNGEDKRLICYICLKYSYQRNLPLFSAINYKRQIFQEYERKGMFK